jgi:hypothetical protein
MVEERETNKPFYFYFFPSFLPFFFFFQNGCNLVYLNTFIYTFIYLVKLFMG